MKRWSITLAQRRCAEYDKQPDFNAKSMDEDVSLATFRCQ